MTFLMRHLKGLIFDCPSFTKSLITSLSNFDSEAPASNKSCVTPLLPRHAAECRGVLP